MMKKDPEEAVTLLQQSLNGASVVKSLPPDAMFYLGRAQQMSGKFSEAITSYSLYTEQVGKKTSREQGVPGYIQECESRKGIVTAAAVKPAAAVSAEKTAISKPEYQPSANDADKKTAGKEIEERKELPAEYENLLDEALRLQYKADSLNLLAGEQKNQLEKLPEPERASMKMKIGQNEMLAASYQKTADLKYSEAQSKMNPGHETVPEKRDTEPQVVKKEPVKAEEDKKYP